MSAPGSPLTGDPILAAPGALALPASVGAMSLTDRLGVVDELLRALELVTQAGQEHVMKKILGILRREILRVAAPFTAADLTSILNAMAELEHEAGRIAPTAAAFDRHARVVTGVLEQT